MIQSKVILFFKHQPKHLKDGQPTFLVPKSYGVKELIPLEERDPDDMLADDFEIIYRDVEFVLRDDGIANDRTDHVLTFAEIEREIHQRDIDNDMSFDDAMSAYLIEIANEQRLG